MEQQTFFYLQLLLIFLISSLLLNILAKTNKTEKKKDPPGPWRLPIVGNLFLLNPNKPLRSLISLSNKHGPLILLHLGSIPTLVVSSRDIAEEIFTKHDLTFSGRPFLTVAKKLLYNSSSIAFAPYGDHWRQARKIAMLELLSSRRVRSFEAVRREEVEKLVATIRDLSIANLSELTLSFTNNVVCRAALGDEFGDGGYGGKGGVWLHQLLSETQSLFGGFCVADFFPGMEWIDRLRGFHGRMEKNFEEMNTFFDRVIYEHLKMREKEEEIRGEEEKDLVHVLLRLHKAAVLHGGFLSNIDHVKAILVVKRKPSWNRRVGSYRKLTSSPSSSIKKIVWVKPNRPTDMATEAQLPSDSSGLTTSGSRSRRKRDALRGIDAGRARVCYAELTSTTDARRGTEAGCDATMASRRGAMRLGSRGKRAGGRGAGKARSFRAYAGQEAFIAGTDTSSATIIWAMIELIRNPRVMKKLQEELQKATNGNSHRLIQESELEKLEYLKQVIKESLRLKPPLIPRETIQECEIQGYTIPAYTRVIINAAAITTDPNIWENPLDFLPERFEGMDVDFKGHDFELLPFGFGRRKCPGINFTMVIVELALANLLHCFDWSIPNGIKAEDINMEEAIGVARHKKEALCLVAKPKW
ncbi:cytochrome P450 71A9-like [Dendrobium catenatum]|uniref:cytochrome P450 71A9-like n=1 Tax=Dendrobium catenatum TaxID=906689 RepID=UPI00109F7E15|nr:cytochrome P450 71A9-like [Dendrobium catenatum]